MQSSTEREGKNTPFHLSHSNLFSISRVNHLGLIVPHVSDLKVLSHEQVERGAGVAADRAHAAAAVTQ